MCSIYGFRLCSYLIRKRVANKNNSLFFTSVIMRDWYFSYTCIGFHLLVWKHFAFNLVCSSRVVSRFLSRRSHPKSRRLFSFYFSSIMLWTDLLTFGVAAAVFGIAGGKRRLLAYFDNPAVDGFLPRSIDALQDFINKCFKLLSTSKVSKSDSNLVFLLWM